MVAVVAVPEAVSVVLELIVDEVFVLSNVVVLEVVACVLLLVCLLCAIACADCLSLSRCPFPLAGEILDSSCKLPITVNNNTPLAKLMRPLQNSPKIHLQSATCLSID
jgi:hypothetical protein